MKWRLIIDSERDCCENMALDLSMQRLYKVPTLRIYKWRPCAVTVGRFQDIKEEVDIDFCKKNNIDFTRRVTGGGAVFHDKELTYSVCISENDGRISCDLHKSYEEICGCIIKALSNLGLVGSYHPINDILVNGKKISGCAQTRKNSIILHHGTLLLEVDVDRMFRVLKVQNEKLRFKKIKNAKDRVTSLCIELKKQVDEKKVVECIVNGFKEGLGIEFETGDFTSEEKDLAEKIKKEIFENEKWIYER